MSHPSLDTIVQLTNSLYDECKCITKLTGAGGGGCCFTYLEENVDENVEERLNKVRARIEDHSSNVEYNYKCFTSSVGGDGVLWL